MSETKANDFLMDLIKKASEFKRLGTLKKHQGFPILKEITEFLPTDASVSRRIWHFNNNCFTIPKCKRCTNDAPWAKEKGGYYRTYCSSKCAHNDPNVKEKTKNTNLKRYGHTTSMQNHTIRENIKAKWLKNHGVDNPSKSSNIKEKKKETCLKNHGVEYGLQSTKIQDKLKQTNIERYEVENVFASKAIQNKIKQTNRERYDVETPMESETIRNKSKETNLKRYGAEHVWCAGTTTRAVQQKTMMTKYNTVAISTLSDDILNKLNDPIWLTTQHHNLKKPLYVIGAELNVSPDTVKKYLDTHNIKLQTSNRSIIEREIDNWIHSLGIKTEHNNRTLIGKELDIFIPEFNLAIEYNGLYWHCELNKQDPNYHLNKTKLCEEKGIRLIHIFEDEWRDQQQKCKDTIKHLLGKSPKGVFARNTTIKEIPWKQAKDFLNKYHLLNAGTCGNYRIGAFDKEHNLIGVMVFGYKTNEGTDKSIELKRFITNKKNNPGLGSKMFKYAVTQKQYNEVIAFVDRRWFTGLVKQYIGFNVVGNSAPALWWTDCNNRYHRRFKTKQQLINNGADLTTSKREMLLNFGFTRIWDCGKIKLQWKNTT